MIEVKNLVKKYGNHVAVDGLTFSIDKGRGYGFLGTNGAGKTTTMNIITGYLAATKGSVTVNGYDLSLIHILAGKMKLIFPRKWMIFCRDTSTRKSVKCWEAF